MFSFYFSRPDTVGGVFALATAVLIWASLWWVIFSKVGFIKEIRLLLLVAVMIPKSWMVISMALLILPWPVWREVRQLRDRVKGLNGQLMAQEMAIGMLKKKLKEQGILE